MKIKCPKCSNNTAILSDDFTDVKCGSCNLNISYSEYIKYIAYNDNQYSDILGDYQNTNYVSEETLDNWE
ncbi:MAG: hypothetical protein KAF24_04650 [Nitrosopumilaceae archaeon]|nr:hypothetical protein [Nitrosopumilaceae archaeon]